MATVTTTQTSTATPVDPSAPVIYPNPSHGGSVNILPPFFTGSSDITIQVFTSAYRKVQEIKIANERYGTVVLETKDARGMPLSNGLYYIVVTTKNGRAILKLSILR
jgi:hypothetical protein